VNRTLILIAVISALAIALGCGGNKKESEALQTSAGQKQTAERAAADDSVITGGAPRRLPTVTGDILDSLRVKKQRFHITQDQYWEDQGGVLANEYFEVWYPAGAVTVTHGMYVFEELMPARKTFEEFFGDAPRELLVIRCSPNLDSYKLDTGREWWYYSEIKGDSAVFCPVWLLFKRAIAMVAVPHEYYQWAVRKTTRGGAPRWLEEGVASYLAGEGELLLNQMYEFASSDVSMTPEKIETVLQGEEDRQDSRIAYYHSYRMVKKLIETFGEDRFKQAVLQIGMGKDLDQAFMTSVQKDYAAVLQVATDYTVDLSQKKKS